MEKDNWPSLVDLPLMDMDAASSSTEGRHGKGKDWDCEWKCILLIINLLVNMQGDV